MTILPPAPQKGSDESLAYLRLIASILCDRTSEYKVEVRIFIDGKSQSVIIDGCGLRNSDDYTGMDFFLNGRVHDGETVTWCDHVNDIEVVPSRYFSDGLNFISESQPLMTVVISERP